VFKNSKKKKKKKPNKRARKKNAGRELLMLKIQEEIKT
jgi:hypothetical protein